MTRAIQSIAEVATNYDAVVLDQWGVLHDGTTPYPSAIASVTALKAQGVAVAVLSNSGKRAIPNAARIAAMGFDVMMFDQVMTSGEALWRDIDTGLVPEGAFFPIERMPGDAAHWAEGLDIDLTANAEKADAILLMGLPDGDTTREWDGVMDRAFEKSLPVYCSNPDRSSPRANGVTVVSPGTLAHDHVERGGKVVFYGKPHRPIFDALQSALNASRLLMVGDSLDHDIAGAHGAGWDSLLIQNGLYAAAFAETDPDQALDELCTQKACPPPTFRSEYLA